MRRAVRLRLRARFWELCCSVASQARSQGSGTNALCPAIQSSPSRRGAVMLHAKEPRSMAQRGNWFARARVGWARR
jgi:hypothetical protein